MSLKTWSVKIYPEEHDRITSIIKVKKKNEELRTGKKLTNREAFLSLLDDIEPIAEVIRSSSFDEKDLMDLCDLGFLQKIADPKTGIKKWYCLRGSRPDRQAKPVLMGDGFDEDSIRKLCEACKTGYLWSEQRKLSEDQIQAIKRFGEETIEANLFICNHPDTEYIQLSPNPSNSFLCLLTGNRQVISKKCQKEFCEHLIHHTFQVIVKETPQFQEMKKQLEGRKQG